MRIVVILIVFVFPFAVSAQSDTASHMKSDSIPSLGIFHQLAYSSIGYAIGFLPGGYYHIGAGRNDPDGGSIVWVFTAPIMSSLGTDLAKTNFWRVKNVNGSFFGGILGGFLGELAGGLISFNYKEKTSPVYYYLALWLPTSILSVAFYNLIGDGLAVPNEYNGFVFNPIISPNFKGLTITRQF